MHYDIIDLSEEIDPAKNTGSKECIVCHYWFNHGFKFQNSACNVCHDFPMLCPNISDIGTITVKAVDCGDIIHGISKSEAIHLLENSVLDDRGYI